VSTLLLLSLSTAPETGGTVRGSDRSGSTSRDEADGGADGNCLLAPLASRLGGIVPRSEKAIDTMSAFLIKPGYLWLSCSHSVDVERCPTKSAGDSSARRFCTGLALRGSDEIRG
jgi:hypothetical protein